jgi:uncharacterized OsmC-like protein
VTRIHADVQQCHQRLLAQYRKHPLDAVTSKWARTRSDLVTPGDPYHGEVEIGRGYGATFRYGIDRYVGGLHDLPNPGDLLCAALAACLDGTIRMIAGLIQVGLVELSVEVRGDLDVRGTLLIDPAVPVGFQQLDCQVCIRAVADTDPRQLARLLELAERSCVNLNTLQHGLTVKTAIAAADSSG